MLRLLLCSLAAAVVSSGFPSVVSAQVVGDGYGPGWRSASPRFGFFQVSRRQAVAPYEDEWQSRDPLLMGSPMTGPQLWDEGGWMPEAWGMSPGTDGCCEPLCDPCAVCCEGMPTDGLAPSPVAPGTPRALPVPNSIDPANPSPEYVPRNKVPMPVEPPDDPNWQKIPEARESAPARKVTPEAPAPVDLPMDIPIPGPAPERDARKPVPARTSSRFIPVPRPTAARVMSLQPEVRR